MPLWFLLVLPVLYACNFQLARVKILACYTATMTHLIDLSFSKELGPDDVRPVFKCLISCDMLWFKCCTIICGLIKIGLRYNLRSISLYSLSPWHVMLFPRTWVWLFLAGYIHIIVCRSTYVIQYFIRVVILYRNNVCYF